MFGNSFVDNMRHVVWQRQIGNRLQESKGYRKDYERYKRFEKISNHLKKISRKISEKIAFT